MILVVTNKRDITTDFVILELRRRGIDFVRLNSEDIPATQVSFTPDAGWTLVMDGEPIALSSVRAAYYRRPGTPETGPEITDKAVRAYVAGEWSAVLRSLWNALDGRWLNSPFSILRAEDKPRQLAEAAALGFTLPDTIIGNDFDRIAPWLGPGDAIGKPLRHALLERGPTGEVLFTSRLGSLDEADRCAVAAAPVSYQREIRKDCDIRATVVGRRVFAAAIGSQVHPETEVDWRCGTRIDLEHDALTLPPEIEARCIALVEMLGLRYGAVDLIRDRDGQYWFLEINPNGQWAWIERRTGQPIAAAIVDSLLEIAGP